MAASIRVTRSGRRPRDPTDRVAISGHPRCRRRRFRPGDGVGGERRPRPDRDVARVAPGGTPQSASDDDRNLQRSGAASERTPVVRRVDPGRCRRDLGDRRRGPRPIARAGRRRDACPPGRIDRGVSDARPERPREGADGVHARTCRCRGRGVVDRIVGAGRDRRRRLGQRPPHRHRDARRARPDQDDPRRSRPARNRDLGKTGAELSASRTASRCAPADVAIDVAPDGALGRRRVEPGDRVGDGVRTRSVACGDRTTRPR